MMKKRYILLLDSSTDYCTVALAEEGDTPMIIAEAEETDRSRQSERLAVMAQEVLSQLPQGNELSAICVAEGPGSYTGLRIAAGYAKGLAFAKRVPLLAISTTQLIARSYLAHEVASEEALLMPMIDARRMEVYSALYTAKGEPVSDIAALVLTEEKTQASITELVEQHPVVYFGSGAEKAQELFQSLIPGSQYVANIYPHAKHMASDAFRLLEAGEHLDVAYWEPFYLKEYQAKKSLNKVLAQLLPNK